MNICLFHKIVNKWDVIFQMIVHVHVGVFIDIPSMINWPAIFSLLLLGHLALWQFTECTFIDQLLWVEYSVLFPDILFQLWILLFAWIPCNLWYQGAIRCLGHLKRVSVAKYISVLAASLFISQVLPGACIKEVRVGELLIESNKPFVFLLLKLTCWCPGHRGVLIWLKLLGSILCWLSPVLTPGFRKPESLHTEVCVMTKVLVP